MTDYERGLTDADAIVASWLDPRRSSAEVELIQAIRADLALKICAIRQTVAHEIEETAGRAY